MIYTINKEGLYQNKVNTSLVVDSIGRQAVCDETISSQKSAIFI